MSYWVKSISQTVAMVALDVNMNVLPSETQVYRQVVLFCIVTEDGLDK